MWHEVRIWRGWPVPRGWISSNDLRQMRASTVCKEQGDDGVAFTLWGQLASSELRGAYFTASYNCASRTGRRLSSKRPNGSPS